MTNNDDFKKILDESLKPLQCGLDEVRGGLKEVKGTQKDHTRRLEVLSEVKATHDEIGLWHQRDKLSYERLFSFGK